MRYRQLRLAALLVTLGFMYVVAAAQVAPSKRDALAMKRKVETIASFSGRPSRQQRRTAVTENEVNSYLLYEAGPQVPVGVAEPTVTIMGAGRLSARAVVDLDAVRKSKPSTGLLDPRNFLMGRVPVTAVGVLHTNGGSGQFNLESASVAGVPIPKIFLQEIVSFYSRTPERSAGIRLDDPFALPAGIREVQIQRGQAVIVQ